MTRRLRYPLFALPALAALAVLAASAVLAGLAGPAAAQSFSLDLGGEDGSTLFVNVQAEGITLAIQGPWQRG